MISSSLLKKYSSLLQKKFREEHKLFLVEGSVVIEEALNAGKIPQTLLTLTDFALPDSLQRIVRRDRIHVELLKSEQLKKLSDTVHPQGIIGVFSTAGFVSTNINGLKSHNVLYLNKISDPGNMGTILRTAAWFGINEIVLSDNCVEIFNPKVIRSAMGSVFKLKFYSLQSDNLSLLKDLEYRLLLTDMNGKEIGSLDKKSKSVIILNNEAHGADDNVKALADEIISIPGSGNAESLNVAVAAGIIMHSLSSAQRI